MSVATVYAISREAAPTLEETMLGVSKERYEAEMLGVVHSLGALANLTLEERRAVAFAIVGEDIPEVETRESLQARYGSDSPSFRRPGLNALDGGYHAMWARARTT